MTKRKAVLLLVFVLLSYAYLWRWHYWSKGVVLICSQSPYTDYHPPTIIVRKLPLSASPWEVPFSFFSDDDSPRNRCELYSYGVSVHNSAQTYFTGSGTSKTATVVWEKSGGATVYIDGVRAMVLDQYGYWIKPQ